MLLALAALFALSRENYLLFHGVSETIAVVIASGILIVAWNTRRIAADDFLLTLGIGQAFVGSVLVLHMFTYPGMGVFPDAGANPPTQLWVLSRFLEAGAFMAAGVVLTRRVSPWTVFAVLAVLTGIALATIWIWPVFPVMYVDGVGLTAAKVATEGIVVALFLVNIVLLWHSRRRFDPRVVRLLVVALALLAAAELTFTLYVDVTGTLNFLGHFLTLIGYALIYRALIEATLQQPYQTLFAELNRREESERRIADTLQAAILTAPTRLSGIETGHAYMSATASARVGGDFWDVFAPVPGSVAFALGDVCGKGIEAAATTVMVRSTLRGFVYDDPDPRRVLTRTNDAMLHQLSDDKFVTVIYGVVDTRTGHTAIASAGHPLPVASIGDRQYIMPMPVSPPLGVSADVEFATHEAEWLPGAMLVLFSDGVMDAGRAHGECGEQAVIDHVRVHRDLAPAELAASLLDAVVKHADGHVTDDVAVVVLRRDRF